MVVPRTFAGRLERNYFASRGGVDRRARITEDAMSGWRPGEKRPDRESMLRVNQAGEDSATRIYAGQLAVFGRSSAAAHQSARMAAQEQRHLERFDRMMAERRVRPTALQPLWSVAGFALGAATAMISEKAAMACTDAVETE